MVEPVTDRGSIPGEDLQPLNVLDKDEFRERTRHLAPNVTDEQFDAHWEIFQGLKQARSLN